MDLLSAISHGSAHMQYALHIYGMPYCLCSHRQIADDINGSTTLREDIFGTNDNGGTSHSYYCKAIPGALTIPSLETISVDDTVAIPESSGWKAEIHDKDYGIDWTASPFYFPSNLRGLPGLQNLPEINNSNVLAKPTQGPLRKDEISIDIWDPEGDIAARETANSNTYLWIGSECVYVTSTTDNSDGTWTLNIQSGTSGHEGRGIWRSVNQSHWGGLTSQSGELISTVPLGSVSGRGCALWAAYYDDSGTKQLGFWKLRHGRIKSTVISKGGLIQIQVGGWLDWLNNEYQVSRGDLHLAKYVFTRGSGEWDYGSLCSEHADTKIRHPHMGVCIAANESGTDAARYFDVWLCALNSTVVFDTIDDVFEALSEELSLCWDGDSSQKSGHGTTDSPYLKFSDSAMTGITRSAYYRPVVVGHTIDVVRTTSWISSYHNYRFYGVIPWLFGTGCMREDSKDFAEYWMKHLGPSTSALKNFEPDVGQHQLPNQRYHFVYPYSILKDSAESIYPFANDDSTSGVIEMPWTCAYYYDANMNNTDWIPPYDGYGGQQIYNLQSLTVPYQSISGNPKYRMYFQPGDDPRIFDTDEQVHFVNQSRVDGEGAKWGLIGTCEASGLDGDYGYVDFHAHDWSTWKSGAEIDPTIPAIRIPLYNYDWKGRPFNQWSSIFYCPGSVQDEYFGGDPFVVRTHGGGVLKKASSAIKAMVGAYGSGSPVGKYSTLDFIPDISGDTDHESTIDWSSMDEALEPLISGHVYRLDVEKSINLQQILSNEMLLHGVTATWELDPSTRMNKIRFKRFAQVNASEAINAGLVINDSTLRAGEMPEIQVNSRFRFNRIDFQLNKLWGKYKLQIPVESAAAKARMGRSAVRSCPCELSYFTSIADGSIGSKDMEELEKHLSGVLDHISIDYPILSVPLTGKIAGRMYAGADLLFSDSRLRDPYTGKQGITAQGVRCISLGWNLKNMSVDAQFAITGKPLYGWAPAAYSPSGSSKFVTDGEGHRMKFVVPTANKNWFTTDGTRPDLSFFADWSYDKISTRYTANSDTDFAVLIIKRFENQEKSYSGTVDASTMDLSDILESNASTVYIDGMNLLDFATTEVAGVHTIDNDLIMIFGSWDTVQAAQRIYVGYAESDGYLNNGSTDDDPSRWQ